MKMRSVLAAALVVASCGSALAQYSSDATGRIIIYTPPVNEAAPDIANAKPMPLPKPTIKPPSGPRAVPLPPEGSPGLVPGRSGSGTQSPTSIPQSSEVMPEDAGPTCGIVCQWPFTTNRARFVTSYPQSATGELFFLINGQSFICSASLIKPGLLVTAAHCVANFGQSRFYSGWRYLPARNGTVAPFGVWTAASAAVLSSYFNGTDSCFQPGVICQDDVAVILLRPQLGLVPGNITGWLGYGWNGYGFFNGRTEVAQLGYPCNLDSCRIMERSDSQGFTDGVFSFNTIIGSAQEGGSSGGPWPVNFGIAPVGLQASALARNIVVGVTSWGFIDPTIMEQGASPFTSGNIVPLVGAFCPHAPQC
jgi:hypothetical protein